MSILSGAMTLDGTPISDGVVSAIRTSLSRNRSHTTSEHLAVGLYLCKIDLGAHGGPAFAISPSGAATAVAGHPLLRDITGDRGAHLTALQASLDRDDWTILETARGTFSAIRWDPSSRTLSLIADKVGVRPLFYHVGQNLVVFASALRILEALQFVPKMMDLRGITELALLGYPLGRRTPYADIHTLHSGEVVHVRAASVEYRQYWRWDRVAEAGTSDTSTVDGIRALFEQAVRDRLGSTRSAVAFLSGGLDSRCIVSVLRAMGVHVRTFNFFRFAESQDAALAKRVAQALGSEHTALERLQQDTDFTHILSRILAAERGGDGPAPTAWAGDGGSVGLGLVYVDPDIVGHMRARREQEALRTFFARYAAASVPRRMLRPEIAQALAPLPLEGAVEELAALPDAEPGRRFHLFLLVNDQRRHLSAHFEDLDLGGLELHLPFFDADFLSAVLRAPLDESLGHDLYMRWVDVLPPVTRSVPWQTYPGHLPCPLPVPPELVAQWDDRSRRFLWRANRKDRLRQLWRVVSSPAFPSPLLSRVNLFAYLAAYLAGIADYGWVAVTAHTFHHYWTRTAGRYAVSALRTP